MQGDLFHTKSCKIVCKTRIHIVHCFRKEFVFIFAWEAGGEVSNSYEKKLNLDPSLHSKTMLKLRDYSRTRINSQLSRLGVKGLRYQTSEFKVGFKF